MAFSDKNDSIFTAPRLTADKVRVEHLAMFEKLVSAIASRTLRILMEHIDSICRVDSELSFDYRCSFKTPDIFEVIVNS